MSKFSSSEFIESKKWIASAIQAGHSWDSVYHMCVDASHAYEAFIRLRDEELTVPQNMSFIDWEELVDEVKANHKQIMDMYGLSANAGNNSLTVPTNSESPWVRYKSYLRGKMGEDAVDLIEKNCHWILKHLKRDTRASEPVKGLVMGSVQSGKTANMIGLVTMAAHYDWNVFIVLSGTIDNLRIQTRNRFASDLLRSGGVSWHILDHTGNPDYLVDIRDRRRYLPNDLSLNLFQEGSHPGKWMHRYVIVCLKNSTRLRNLINWLHDNPSRAAKMRILIIDDEADQASVNTRKMGTVADEEEIERTAVNQLIIDLANGKESDGSATTAPFQALNYISFTATPYANVLNEAYASSLYPKDFICSLPESKEYFGTKVIFGSTDGEYPGLNIVRTVPQTEVGNLKSIHDGATVMLPGELKNALCWFLCSAAVLRNGGYRKPISMLIHTTAIQNGHLQEYEALKNWLVQERNTGIILGLCQSVYAREINAFTLDDLIEGYPDYSAIGTVARYMPSFEDIKAEIVSVLSEIENIMLGDDRTLSYHENGIHLCVDNCKANRYAEEGNYLRLVYPSEAQLKIMKKAPVFIVMGGNTLSRGLTIEGLVCTYFARNTNQADTLMQMGRWFGYRRGYELLQRIWLPLPVQQKFELLEKIDENLKSEFEDFMEKGLSPSQFGPKIMSTASIAKFMITAKNKSQNAEDCDFDFSGYSDETTKFIDDHEMLLRNIVSTETFLFSLGTPAKSRISPSALIWRDIGSERIINDYLRQYHIFDCENMSADIRILSDWIAQMNSEGRYRKWNVAVAGDKGAAKRWDIGGESVGMIERSRKKTPSYIDIGSLRSGTDALCDVDAAELSDEQKTKLSTVLGSRKGIVAARGYLNLSDIPLLLIYRVDKDLGKDSKLKTKLNCSTDIVGFSIIVSGDADGQSHSKAVRVVIPE